MSVNQRQQEITQIIKTDGEASVSALSKRFGVSSETIRRDFKYLERVGVLIRSYGGAVLSAPSYPDKVKFQERRQQHMQEKTIIGEIAQNLISKSASLCCDGSTTVLALLEYLKDRSDIIIMTNSVIALSESIDSKYSLISTGGNVNASSQYLVGPVALEAVGEYHFDYYLAGAKGIDTAGNIFDSDESETDVKRAFLKNSDTKILVLDHSKFGRKAFKCWSNLDHIDYLVTDRKPEKEWIRLCEQNNVRLLYPDSE